ncbi:MAG: hypothetical protein IPK79_09810 [Vampirovibrionales bacterium]|nr:hypothetical protein [Vampirovibrionales bacterium]
MTVKSIPLTYLNKDVGGRVFLQAAGPSGKKTTIVYRPGHDVSPAEALDNKKYLEKLTRRPVEVKGILGFDA